MKLSRLLERLPDARRLSFGDMDVRSVVSDSRQVTAGALFVAIPSLRTNQRDTERHIAEAVGRGAIGVVHQGGEVPGVATVHVGDPRAFVGCLAAAFYDQPSRHLRLFAITGTDGKTTTSYLLEQIFAAAGLTTGLLGTVETKVGVDRRNNLDRMTTPDAIDVQRHLRQMVRAGVTHAIVEASSHALALDRLRGCTFAACAVTNITTDHVEFHGSWEAYFQAKATLFTELGQDCPAVLNRDDKQFSRLAELLGRPTLTYGFHAEADLRAVSMQAASGGFLVEVAYAGTHEELLVPLPGRFNISNGLAASALAITAGLSLETIANGLERAEAPPGRMQTVDDGQQFDVLVDYAHTVNAFESVLSNLRDRYPPPARLLAVFGSAGDRDRNKRPILARIARRYTDYFVITNEDPYGEPPEAIVTEVASGVPPEENGLRYDCELDRGAGILKALRRAGPGDVVVVLGKGHEQSIVVGEEKRPWSDVESVHAALEMVR